MPRTNVNQVATKYRRFNDWLRGERKARKIKQKEIAEYLNIPQSQYSKRENGEIEWGFKEILEVLELLETDIKDVL